MSVSFRLSATDWASTKRNPPADANGIVTAPVAHLAGLACTPRVPLDPALRNEVIERKGLDHFARLWQATTTETDIRDGDIWVWRGVDHPIHTVIEWPWRELGSPDEKRLIVVFEERQQG